MLEKLLGLGDAKLQIVKNPFVKAQIVDVSIRAWKHTFLNKETWHFCGRVEFENGNTKGEQKIKGESMNDVITRVDAFVKSLE